MPLFHQRIKPRSCRRPLIVGSLGKNGKKIDQWGGRQNRYEGLGLTTDRPQDAPGGPRQSLTGLFCNGTKGRRRPGTKNRGSGTKGRRLRVAGGLGPHRTV